MRKLRSCRYPHTGEASSLPDQCWRQCWCECGRTLPYDLCEVEYESIGDSGLENAECGGMFIDQSNEWKGLYKLAVEIQIPGDWIGVLVSFNLN